ncbi:MAG: hypothetical protein J2P37_27340, partial [Ktedonobacteraceae bacterium]|nr:hypothetical protein [Ktedonobacteraceae bacterium]
MSLERRTARSENDSSGSNLTAMLRGDQAATSDTPNPASQPPSLLQAMHAETASHDQPDSGAKKPEEIYDERRRQLRQEIADRLEDPSRFPALPPLSHTRSVAASLGHGQGLRNPLGWRGVCGIDVMEQFINYYAPKEHIREITGGREQVTEHDLVLYARNHDLATSDKEAEQWIGKKQQFLIDDDAATLLRKHQENLAASDLVTLVSTKFPDADVPNCHVGMNWSYGFIAAKDAQQMFRLNEKGQDLLSNRDLFLTVADVEQMLRQSQWKGQKSPENNETLKGLRLFGTRDWLGGTSGIEQLQLAAAFGAPARIIGNLVSEGVVQSEIVSLDAH